MLVATSKEAPAARGGVAAAAGVGVGVVEVCAWNAGGDTIVPAGVPGASVGALGAVAGAARPVNACCSSGASFSARWFCSWYT